MVIDDYIMPYSIYIITRIVLGIHEANKVNNFSLSNLSKVKNHKMKYSKTWLLLILIASLLVFMLIIIKHNNADNDIQQKIYDHSEIKDTT